MTNAVGTNNPEQESESDDLVKRVNEVAVNYDHFGYADSARLMRKCVAFIEQSESRLRLAEARSASIRTKTIEECAQVAEAFWDNSFTMMPPLQKKVAQAIRLLDSEHL